jgi:hypothetical protein
MGPFVCTGDARSLARSLGGMYMYMYACRDVPLLHPKLEKLLAITL